MDDAAGPPVTPAARGAAVRLAGVQRIYAGATAATPVLRGIDLAIEPGSLTMILGASGSGKTTLLNIIGAIDHADAGEVSVAGCDLVRAGRRELMTFRRQRVGFIFQFYNLMPTLTACENVEIALEHQARTTRERRAAAEGMLGEVGLAAQVDKFPAQMSGGEQQRVAVARALVRRPQLLLCDEPTGNLDAESGRMVVDLIDRLRREAGSTAVVVTHNPDLFSKPDRVVHVRDGVVVE